MKEAKAILSAVISALKDGGNPNLAAELEKVQKYLNLSDLESAPKFTDFIKLEGIK